MATGKRKQHTVVVVDRPEVAVATVAVWRRDTDQGEATHEESSKTWTLPDGTEK